MTAPTDQASANVVKPLAILMVVVGIAAVLWPSYRKFFINEWRDRIVAGQPVVFIPDCPDITSHFKCSDRYTLVFRKNENSQWCVRIRKNQDPEGDDACGLDPDAWDFARSWRYFSVDGVRLYYSWRGRVVISPVQVVGWLASPENLALRKAHPLSME